MKNLLLRIILAIAFGWLGYHALAPKRAAPMVYAQVVSTTEPWTAGVSVLPRAATLGCNPGGFPITPGVFQPCYGGGASDGFVTAFEIPK